MAASLTFTAGGVAGLFLCDSRPCVDLAEMARKANLYPKGQGVGEGSFTFHGPSMVTSNLAITTTSNTYAAQIGDFSNYLSPE